MDTKFLRNKTTKGGNAMRCPLCNLNNVNLIYDMKNYFITLVSTFTVPSA